ncbi:LysR family transcriptional regulator [Chelativorans sp. AA-79]|uniref:LysR family transcriptional regulator n=1 Tax=Chelativorans sp. AA-79 TaxID=3028735 RepID=UPI0023F6E8AE|nr:LysR family transcriptional regulator [Chelativorans sp. AA-79]WEX12103.1 LysR family transcriptional regulator [Chelativorans sp. AA-79]
MNDEYGRFLAVAEHRSISAAAQVLNLSQPALSRTISLLEERYGTPLFERTSQGVELTEAGKTLFLYASRAVRAIQSAQEEIGHALRLKRRTLRICCGDSWGYGILPRILNDFGSEVPEVSIQVDLLEHDERLRGLDTRNYDVACGVISPEMLDSGRYCFEPLVRAPYDVYCDRDHPLLKQGAPTEADLLAYPWLNHKFEYDYDPSSALRTARVFAHRSNAMMHAIETLRGSQMLMSTAKSMAPLFARFGVVRLMEDPESPIFVSGIILAQESGPNQLLSRLVNRVRTFCRDNRKKFE